MSDTEHKISRRAELIREALRLLALGIIVIASVLLYTERTRYQLTAQVRQDSHVFRMDRITGELFIISGSGAFNYFPGGLNEDWSKTP